MPYLSIFGVEFKKTPCNISNGLFYQKKKKKKKKKKKLKFRNIESYLDVLGLNF